MSKALIEKAFEKFMLDKFGIEAKNIDIKAWNIYKDNFDYAWNKGATWQREQLIKELKEASEIINGLMGCVTGFMTSVGGDYPMLKEKLKEVEQFLAKLDEMEGDKTNE